MMANSNDGPSTPGSTTLSLSEEQVKLMRLAIKHIDVMKVSFFDRRLTAEH